MSYHSPYILPFIWDIFMFKDPNKYFMFREKFIQYLDSIHTTNTKELLSFVPKYEQDKFQILLEYEIKYNQEK